MDMGVTMGRFVPERHNSATASQIYGKETSKAWVSGERQLTKRTGVNSHMKSICSFPLRLLDASDTWI